AVCVQRSRPRGTHKERGQRLSFMNSLRVRLPLVFLAGIALAGVVTTVIAVQLFQSFAHDQALPSLNRQASGIAALYTNASEASYGNKDDRSPPKFAAKN